MANTPSFKPAAEQPKAKNKPQAPAGAQTSANDLGIPASAPLVPPRSVLGRAVDLLK